MRSMLLPLSLSAILLAACSPERSPAVTESVPAAPRPAQGDAAMPADSPAASLPEPGEAGDTPVSSTPDGADAQARFDGYGDMKLGIAADAMAAAWGGELNRLGGPEETCYFMTPKWVKVPSEFAFMVDGGTFVRYGTDSGKYVAPGGGKVGMTAGEIATLYPGRIDITPHKYTEGKYLRVKDAASGNALVFETDPAGKVTQWRVGTPPQVDYIEGCS